MGEKEKKNKPSYSMISNIKYLFSLQWKYSKMSILLLLLAIPTTLGISFCNVYLPKLVVSQISSGNDFYTMITVISIFGIIIGVLNIIESTMKSYEMLPLFKYQESLMKIHSEKALYTDYENLESVKFKTLMERARDTFVNGTQNIALVKVTGGVTKLLTNILGYILFGTILSFASPWLTVILTITPIINYFVVKSIQDYVYKQREDTSLLDKKLWYIAMNCGKLESSKDIRIYSMNDFIVNMYKTITRQRLTYDKKIAQKYFIANIVDAFIILLRDGIAYFVLIYMVIQGSITVDNFILYFGSVGTFAGWISGIINNINEINSASLVACDFRDYLNYEEKSNKISNIDCKAILNKACEIELKNVSYSYSNDDKDIISNLSLKIRSGEKIAIVGLNGAGKTTLIKLICGLYNPTKGQVLVNNIDKNDFNIYDYYSLFSTVFQDFHFLPISIASTISSKSLKNTDLNKVDKCIELAGLSKKILNLEKGIHSMLNKQINHNGIDLSGGEKQKLLLARAIYKDAPILILDEPTAALDPISENEVFLKYNELTKDKTSIYISHRLSSTRFCDRIFYLEDGKIIECGSHDELIELDKKYAYMYNVQSQYYQEDKEVENEYA
ncbi:MAG: ABC transporter ATP-binding protein [Peptostreptococcaceae bacterium]